MSSQHDDDDNDDDDDDDDDDYNDDDDDDKSWFVDRSIRPIKGNFWAIFKRKNKKIILLGW